MHVIEEAPLLSFLPNQILQHKPFPFSLYALLWPSLINMLSFPKIPISILNCVFGWIWSNSLSFYLVKIRFFFLSFWKLISQTCSDCWEGALCRYFGFLDFSNPHNFLNFGFLGAMVIGILMWNQKGFGVWLLCGRNSFWIVWIWVVVLGFLILLIKFS